MSCAPVWDKASETTDYCKLLQGENSFAPIYWLSLISRLSADNKTINQTAWSECRALIRHYRCCASLLETEHKKSHVSQSCGLLWSTCSVRRRSKVLLKRIILWSFWPLEALWRSVLSASDSWCSWWWWHAGKNAATPQRKKKTPISDKWCGLQNICPRIHCKCYMRKEMHSSGFVGPLGDTRCASERNTECKHLYWHLFTRTLHREPSAESQERCRMCRTKLICVTAACGSWNLRSVEDTNH